MTEPRKTPRTDACELWAHPEYVQQIRFEGCDVLAVAPEDYSAQFEHARHRAKQQPTTWPS